MFNDRNLSLIIRISSSVQVYGDTSFQDCRRASEEAIEIIIKNLQVYLLVLVAYTSTFLLNQPYKEITGLYEFVFVISLNF